MDPCPPVPAQYYYYMYKSRQSSVRPSVDRPTKWSMTYFAACLFARTPRPPRSPPSLPACRTRAHTARLPDFLRCRLPSDSTATAAAAAVVVTDGGGVGRSVGRSARRLVGRTPNHPLNLFTLFYDRSRSRVQQLYDYEEGRKAGPPRPPVRAPRTTKALKQAYHVHGSREPLGEWGCHATSDGPACWGLSVDRSTWCGA